jgi:cephalosporin hydroxylase
MEQARTVDVFRCRAGFVQGSTIDPAVVACVPEMVEGYRTMVILDSAHDTTHVAAELDASAPMMTPVCI